MYVFTYRQLDNYDPRATLRIWGREQFHVHQDILDSMGFCWDMADSEGKFVFLSEHQQ